MISKETVEENAPLVVDPPSHARHVSTDELFRVYGSFVARLLSRMGVRNDELDDAVQEVFLAAHKNGGYAPGAAKPSTYLARLAFHTALGERRRARRQWARHSERVPEELASSGADPARLVETQQTFGDVDRALGKLNPTLRATLWLADAEGESCVSIAAASEVPVGTVYWRLDRARKQFRDALRRIDAQRSPRRALGIFVLSWRRETNRTEVPAPDVQHLLARFRSFASTRYDAARGLARFQATLASGGAAEVAVVSTIAVAKGIAALSAACVAVVAGLAVPRSADPREQQVVVAAARAVPSAAPSSREAAPKTAVSPDVLFDSADASAVLSAQPRANGTREDPRSSRRAPRSSRRSSEASRAAASSAQTVRAPSPVTQSSSDDAGHDEPERTESADEVVARERPPSPSEVAQVARAARLLAQQPREALAAVRALPRGIDGAYLLEEREYIEVMALLALGERREGTRRAHAFLRRYPSSAFSRTIRTVTARRS